MAKDMTPKEFNEKYNRGMCFDNEFTPDLTSVIRGKLIEFVCKLRGCHPKSKYGELLIQQIDIFLAENGFNVSNGESGC